MFGKNIEAPEIISKVLLTIGTWEYHVWSTCIDLNHQKQNRREDRDDIDKVENIEYTTWW